MIGTDTLGHVLDCSPSDDLRNFNYVYEDGDDAPSGRVGAALPDVFWGYGGVELYQDGIGACAGFSGAGWLAVMRANNPRIRQRVPFVDDGTGLAIYHEAQRRDEWAGESYEGTSINAVCKVLLALGLIVRYEWVRSYAGLRSAIRKGPLLRGWNWTENMSRPNAQGIITDVGGPSLGGHATLMTGDLDSLGALTTHRNWWQRSPRYLWGHDGNFYVPRALDERKFNERAECALLYVA